MDFAPTQEILAEMEAISPIDLSETDEAPGPQGLGESVDRTGASASS